MVNKLVILKVI